MRSTACPMEGIEANQGRLVLRAGLQVAIDRSRNGSRRHYHQRQQYEEHRTRQNYESLHKLRHSQPFG